MSNSGGRKVYRNSTYNKKKRIKKAIGIFLTIIVIAILVFFGYSIAKPIFNYLNSENSAGEEQTEPWTPPVVTDIEENNDAEQENDEQVLKLLQTHLLMMKKACLNLLHMNYLRMHFYQPKLSFHI